MNGIILENATKTEKLGKALGELLFPGSIVLLQGDLGTGKTTFTKGIAEGMKVDLPVTSPTFTIIKEYSGEKNILYHVDTYRMEEEEELSAIGFEDYLNSEGVVVIEWPEILDNLLPDEYLKINFTRKEEENRVLEFEAQGDAYQEIVREMIKNAGISC